MTVMFFTLFTYYGLKKILSLEKSIWPFNRQKNCLSVCLNSGKNSLWVTCFNVQKWEHPQALWTGQHPVWAVLVLSPLPSAVVHIPAGIVSTLLQSPQWRECNRRMFPDDVALQAAVDPSAVHIQLSHPLMSPEPKTVYSFMTVVDIGITQCPTPTPPPCLMPVFKGLPFYK